ncbi:hypothetical protein BDQ12DRAFT_734128 [Crucibulum laeve]|uniref:F-box domain-containing protein n=1 Tax=Crucibulum laeve TaxID=68775 RepID=A0A5C3M6U2_9AGAR|nr:hypothetical protein BDQ12DRAFT_734128 [Crucibulum laeve]
MPISTGVTCINLLPPETLSYIFTFCLPEDYLLPSVRDAPLLLGYVSRLWRAVSLTTPLLWSSIQIHISRPSAALRLFRGVDAWLKRACSEPLSIIFSCPSSSLWTCGMSKALSTMLNTLLLYAHQCRRLTLQIGSGGREAVDRYLFPLHLLQFPDSLPLLRELDISFHFANREAFLSSIVRAAPYLQKVTIGGFSVSIATLRMSGSSLISLVTNSKESVQSCQDVLSRFPDLKRCRFDLHPMDNDHHAGQEEDRIVLHHNLKQLYLGPTNHAQFFASVTLPSIEQLTIDGQRSYSIHLNGPYKIPISHSSTWGQRDFIGFIYRSACSLTKVSFFHLDMSTRDLMECLISMSPSLRELDIEGGREGTITPKIINALTCVPYVPKESMRGVVLCPLLESIGIRGYIFGNGGPGRQMVDMLSSRFRNAVSTARLSHAYIGGQYSPRQRQRLRELRRDGLDVVVDQVESCARRIFHDRSIYE